MGADASTARKQGDIRASFTREPLQELPTAQQLKIMAETQRNIPAMLKGRDDIRRPAKVSAQLLVKPGVLEQPPSRIFEQSSVDQTGADASIGRRQDEIKTGCTRKPSMQPKAAPWLHNTTQTKCDAPGVPKGQDIRRSAKPLVQSVAAQQQNIKTQRSMNPLRVPKGLDDRPRTLAMHAIYRQPSGHGTRKPSLRPAAAQRLDTMTQIKRDAPELPNGHDIHRLARPPVQSAVAQQQNIETQRSWNPPRLPKGVDEQPRTMAMQRVDPESSGHRMEKAPQYSFIREAQEVSSAVLSCDGEMYSSTAGLASAQERVLAVEALLPNHQNPRVAVLPKEDLLGSCPAKHIRHSSSDRKQARKEDRKYRKLCEIWKCSPIQIQTEHDVDIGDQKWLFDCSIKQSGANPTNSYKATDAPLQCQSSDHPVALQPRSVYRQDLQMYQLPYVVPF